MCPSIITWEKRKLGEFAEKAIDNRGKTPPTSEQGDYSLLEVAAIGGYYPDYSKVSKYVNKEIFNNWFRAHPQKVIFYFQQLEILD